jgi:hypothetical protein
VTKPLKPLLFPDGDVEDEGALGAKFASLATKLHVRQLERWWMVLAQALDIPPPGGAQIARFPTGGMGDGEEAA